jgi:hypothetical protein
MSQPENSQSDEHEAKVVRFAAALNSGSLLDCMSESLAALARNVEYELEHEGETDNFRRLMSRLLEQAEKDAAQDCEGEDPRSLCSKFLGELLPLNERTHGDLIEILVDGISRSCDSVEQLPVSEETLERDAQELLRRAKRGKGNEQS